MDDAAIPQYGQVKLPNSTIVNVLLFHISLRRVS